MKSLEIRESFLNYFKAKGLTIAPSSPLVPHADPTLLFTSAGMVQFKANFLGLKKNLKNAATVQKCLRTTDIDNVGFTKRHLTFFEMLGNFSFGDYFKKEAIVWAWDFLTKELGLDKERLYVSIYKGGIAPRDEEAYNIWSKILDKERIFEFGEADNFWTMGPTGPCGPCSEIYYDFGEKNACPHCKDKKIACDCGRYVEIWNLVFTQFNRLEDGSLEALPQKNIDTGMGLERLAMVMQNADNPFDTDLFLPIAEHAKKILEIKGKNKLENTALRIIADHVRAAVFLISEGVLPSNEGRGYILRRLIRRAARYGRLMGRSSPFMWELVPTVISVFQNIYPELVSNIVHIQNTLKTEGNAFYRTLNDGEQRLQEIIKSGAKQVSGEEAFYLYETYGFPLELTKEILAQKKISLDEQGFYAAQEKAKECSKTQCDEFEKEKVLTVQKLESSLAATKFVGYETLQTKSKILALLNKQYQPVEALTKEGYVIFDRTPFYAECGGQVGDIGTVEINEENSARVQDTQKPLDKLYLHKISVITGAIKMGDVVNAKVDAMTRLLTSANHTAVHVINYALKKVLGPQVRQAGSHVNSERLRFDYTCSKTPSPMDFLAIWTEANNIVMQSYPVWIEERPLSDAKKFGATVLLGEHYADPARFILINREGFSNPQDKISLELCGGTHVKNTIEIMAIRILKEFAVSSGVRRIEATASFSAVEYLKMYANSSTLACKMLGTSVEELCPKVEKLINSERELKKEIARLKKQLLSGAADSSLQKEFTLKDGAALIAFNAQNTEIKELRTLSDNMADKNPKKVILIATDGEGKKSFVVKSYEGGPDAGALAKQISALINGRGGGKQSFAQGGGEALAWQDFVAKLSELS